MKYTIPAFIAGLCLVIVGSLTFVLHFYGFIVGPCCCYLSNPLVGFCYSCAERLLKALLMVSGSAYSSSLPVERPRPR